MTTDRKSNRRIALAIAATAALALTMGGGSADAGSKVGAKKLKDITVRSASITVPAGSAKIVTTQCEPKERALTVGATWNGAPTLGPVSLSSLTVGPSTNPTEGSAAGFNDGNSDRVLTVFVSCLHK